MNYERYYSTSGLSTKEWGPACWKTLFMFAMGYPVKIDNTDSEHLLILHFFKHTFVGLGYTMPCIFCRQSFKQFIKELPIEPFLVGRIELMYWLYLMKDKVNNKLRKQEMKCFLEEKQKLYDKFTKNKLTHYQYASKLKKLESEILVTKKSPSFESVLNKYEQYRAVCSTKAQSCILAPKK